MNSSESLESADAIAILQQFRDRLEDMDDRLEMARARQRNGDKPGIPWEQAKKELGLDDLKSHSELNAPA